jgi:hypothetical protein
MQISHEARQACQNSRRRHCILPKDFPWPTTSIPNGPTGSTTSDESANSRFEYRRNMQEIIPNVFLGPLQVARVPSILHANKITLLVPVRTPSTARFLTVPLDRNGAPWTAFPVDITHDQIMTWFYPTFLRVKDEVEKGGRVFIYCENGNGLSAAICVALVMDTRLYGLRGCADVDGIAGLQGNLSSESVIALTSLTGRGFLSRYSILCRLISAISTPRRSTATDCCSR